MKIILCSALILLAVSTHAQKFSAGLNLQLALPHGEYKDVNNRAGIGGRVNFYYKPVEDFPVLIGAELGYGVLGMRTERFYTNYYGFTDEYLVTATNHLFSAMISLRIDPAKQGAFIRPFADGLVGWNDFFSTVAVEQVTFLNNAGAGNSNSSKARWSMAYGGSIGLAVRAEKKGNIYIEGKASYMMGKNTKYLTDPQINNDGSASFAEKESATNMIIPQLGVRFYF